MSDRRTALEFLENTVKAAFSNGLGATIDGRDYFFFKEGEQVQVGDHVLHTSESGIFQKTSHGPYSSEGEGSLPREYTLLHYGHGDQLSQILDHLCRDMSIHQIQMTMVGIASHSVLSSKSIRRKELSDSSLAV